MAQPICCVDNWDLLLSSQLTNHDLSILFAIVRKWSVRPTADVLIAHLRIWYLYHMNRLRAAFWFFTPGHWNQTGTFSDAVWMHSWWYKVKICVVVSFNIQLSLASHSFSKSSERENIPVVSPVTLMLCLWAASMTAGTRSSVGSPWSSATPGGYQDNTSTPTTPQHGEEVWSECSQAWSLDVMNNVGG